MSEALNMSAANAPAPLDVRALPYAGTMRFVAWAFATILGFTIFYFGLVMGSFVPWLALPLVFLGIGLALYCAWRLQRAWREAKANAPVVTVNAKGFHDTRLGETIPWSEVKRLTRHQPGTQVLLQVEAVRAERFLKARRKYLFWSKPAKPVPPGVPVTSNLSGLDHRGDDIVAAAEAFYAASKP